MSTPRPVVVTIQHRKVHHGLHFIMTCATWGLWLPVWVIAVVSA